MILLFVAVLSSVLGIFISPPIDFDVGAAHNSYSLQQVYESYRIAFIIWISVFLLVFVIQLLCCIRAKNKWKKCVPTFLGVTDACVFGIAWLFIRIFHVEANLPIMLIFEVSLISITLGLLLAWGIYSLVRKVKNGRQAKKEIQSAM